MKKNKFLLALTSSFMILALAGCPNNHGGNEPEPEPTPAQPTAEGAAAAVEAVSGLSIGINKKSGMALRPKAGEGDVPNYFASGTQMNLYRTYSYTYRPEKLQYTCELTWGYDQAKYGKPRSEDKNSEGPVQKWAIDNQDENLMFVSFHYSTKEEQSFEFYVDIKCGEAVKHLDFELRLAQLNTEYTDLTIAQLYETADNGSGVAYYKNWQDAKHVSQYTTEEKNIRSKGQAVYAAPDGNFGIVADGENYAYLYKLKEAGFTLEVGKYYEFAGEMGSYKGGVQVSFLSMVNELEDQETHPGVAPAADHLRVTAKNLAKYTSDSATPDAFRHMSDKHARFIEIEAKTTAAITGSSGRFTFKMTDRAGDQFTVAYDYHTEISSALVDKLNAHTNEFVLFRAFITYNTSNTNEWDPIDSGYWQVVPYDVDQIIIGN